MNRFENIDTVIFDMDGTLLDTLEDIKDALNRALKIYGKKERSLEDVRKFVGNGARELVKRALDGEDFIREFDDILDEYVTYYKENSLIKTAPYDGIIEVLKELKNRDYKMAVVSNKPDGAVKELTEKLFPNLMEVAIGESDDIAKKPAPDMVDEALKQMGVSKDSAIYVGDSEVDLMTATNSGLPCISVLWGFREKEILVEKGAQIFVDNPAELLELLR